MTRYRLVSPLGVYAPGAILDTDLPAGQMFSLEGPTARRLAELGVLEPLEPLGAQDPQMPQDEPGWSAQGAQGAAQGAAQHSAPRVPSPERPARLTARPKEQSTR